MTWSESHAQLSGRHDGYRHNPVPRRVRHPAHAGSIFRPRPALALHRGRDRVGARGGALWRHSAGSSGRDRGEMQCRNPRPRSPAPGDRDRRLSDPSLGASAGEAMRRCGPLRPLGSHHAGHHGHGRGAAAARGPWHHRGRCRSVAQHPREARENPSRHADGRAHPPAAGVADHLRIQGRDLARHVRPACRTAYSAQAARPRRRVRGRRRHPRISRREGTGGAEGVLRGVARGSARINLARGA
jgi:hypothetical protein